MTTARGLTKERVSGFQGGADLYFVKPVDPMELHAAILNLGRRLAQSLPATSIPYLTRLHPRSAPPATSASN